MTPAAASRGGTLEERIVGSRILPPFFPLGGAERVLNVGCGEGPQSVAYRDRFASMVCADLDEERLRFARHALRQRGVGRIAVLRCDAADLPFPSETFDAALAIDLLEHLADPDRALREVARVLRPGGRLLASFPLLFDFYEHVLERAARLRARLLRRRRRIPTVAPWDRHRQERSAREWILSFSQNGFRIERMRASTLFPPLQLLGVRRFWIELGALRRFDAALCALPALRLLGQAMLVACRKGTEAAPTEPGLARSRGPG